MGKEARLLAFSSRASSLPCNITISKVKFNDQFANIQYPVFSAVDPGSGSELISPIFACTKYVLFRSHEQRSEAAQV